MKTSQFTRKRAVPEYPTPLHPLAPLAADSRNDNALRTRGEGTGSALLILIAILLLSACHREVNTTRFPGAPVILISVDTVRADHLPMFGYDKVATPAFDALRKDGILFTSAYSHVPLTFPSHTTIFTGLLPQDNGVRNNIGYHLDASVPTIPSMLKSAGYATGAAVSAYVLRGSTGLNASFDQYNDQIENKANTPVGSLQRSGFDTAAIAKTWIASHESKPFFYFLHLFEPHSPYTPPEPFKSKYASLPYDGEIATADAIVGNFVDFLKKNGIYDRAVIILLSDHGEGLYQHGEPEHGIFVYREAIHVPLVVKLPKSARAGDTVDAPVGLVDILPTIAQVTGARPPQKIDGVSLLAAHNAARRLYSESLYPRIHLGWSELRSLEDAQYQFIQAPSPELYDMKSDPQEKQNVLADRRRVYASMSADLQRFGTSAALPTHIDPEEAKKLTALGYLGSTAGKTVGPLPDPKDRIGELAAMMAAMQLVREGRDAEAIAGFRAILAKNPRLSDAWNQLALTLEQDMRFEEAAAAYRQAIENSPELAGEYGLSLGAVLLKMNRFDEAAQHARLGEKVNPGGSRVLLARIALARKDYRTAEAEARSAQNDPYSHLAASVLLAQIFAEQDRADEALQVIAQAEQDAKKEGAGPVESLEYVRADALARLSRYPEAIAAFQREIAAFPHNRQAYARLALVYALSGQPQMTRATIAAMVKASPSPRTAEFAAHTLEELGDKVGAAQYRR